MVSFLAFGIIAVFVLAIAIIVGIIKFLQYLIDEHEIKRCYKEYQKMFPHSKRTYDDIYWKLEYLEELDRRDGEA